MTVLCIDFGGTEIKMGLAHGSEFLARATMSNVDQPDVLKSVEGFAASLDGGYDAVGIALPGVVHRGSSTLAGAFGKYAWAYDLDFAAWSEDVLGAPGVVANDARAALRGEVRWGCARGARSVVAMTLGTGIGTAAMVEGAMVYGAFDHAGILGGHVTVDLSGPECPCGNIGCAEALASTWALRRDVARSPRLAQLLGAGSTRPVGLKDLLMHAEHPEVVPVVDRYVSAWGAALVSLCLAYDPDFVVLAGGVMRSGLVLPRLRAHVQARLWSTARRPEFLTPKSPESSVMLGLSALAEEHIAHTKAAL